MPVTASTCPYCGVGCGVLIEHDGGAITGVRGDPAHPANHGRLCSKGATLHLTATPVHQQHARVLAPSLRLRREDARVPVGWDAALAHAADRFAAIVGEHGPDAVAFYVSGQLLTEDYYAFNKLAKGLLGTNNIDTNSRLCMSSAVAGYKQTLGADAPPGCYEDLDAAECVFIAGSNMAWAHPVLHRRLEAARAARPDQCWIVVDPRRTDTAAAADLHLPILPGTDVALFQAMLHTMLWEGWIDRAWIDAHTSGFEALRASVAECSPRWAADVCGVPAASIAEAARRFATSRATLSLWCQGLNQSAQGTAKNAALVNLHLVTGQIGRPGAAPFSLTGQPNAMGGREVGGLANLLPAHRDLADPAHRAEVAALWGVDDVPARPGLMAVELFDALADGRVKAVWIACTNPAQSLPNLRQVHAGLRQAEFVVVQEAFADTATTAFADLLLPATTWGEKDGTVTNSERRISRVRPAIPAAGEARHDWAIAVDFGRRLESRLRPGRPTLFPWATPEAVWNEHRETTRGRDLDITGLSYAILERDGPQQWPMPEGAGTGTPRLFGDGVFPTPDGRARLVVTPYRPVAEPVDARFPLRLTTGRLRDQWHGMSRTGRAASLFGHAPEPVLAMHANDLARRGLADGDLAWVSSRRGRQAVRVAASDTMRSGQAFLAMHWGPEFLTGFDGHEVTLGVNTLTSPATDPVSRQPELKHCAIRVERVDAPHRLAAFGWVAPERADAARAAVRDLLVAHGCAHVVAVPFGRDRPGVLVRAASAEALPESLIASVERGFDVPEGALLRYDDARRQVRRHLVVRDGRLSFALLVGDGSSEAWLREYLEGDWPVAGLGRSLLMPGATAPKPVPSSGRTICQCVGVGEARLRDALTAMGPEGGTVDACVQALQRETRCGTQCGSCLPEIRRLALAHASAGRAAA